MPQEKFPTNLAVAMKIAQCRPDHSQLSHYTQHPTVHKESQAVQRKKLPPWSITPLFFMTRRKQPDVNEFLFYVAPKISAYQILFWVGYHLGQLENSFFFQLLFFPHRLCSFFSGVFTRFALFPTHWLSFESLGLMLSPLWLLIVGCNPKLLLFHNSRA